MKTHAAFYHADCPVCVSAALDPDCFEIEVVCLGEDKHRISEASGHGIKSVPALVLDGQVFHINHGADSSEIG